MKRKKGRNQKEKVMIWNYKGANIYGHSKVYY